MTSPISPQLPNSPQPPTSWRSFTNRIGRAWRQFTNLHQKLLELVVRVCSLWKAPLKSITHTPPPLPPIKPSKQPQPTLNNFLFKKSPSLPSIATKGNVKTPADIPPALQPTASNENYKAPNESRPLQSNQAAPLVPNEALEASPHVRVKSEEKAIKKESQAIHPSNEDSERISIQDKMNSPHVISNAIKLPNAEEDRHTIDVPDKGDCLFCAIGVGIKLLYNESEAIQSELNWTISPDLLKKNLKNEEALLSQPSRRLRQQAADFLEKNRHTLPVMISLMGGIIDHNEIVEKKIQSEQAITVILEDDIEVLKERLKGLDPATHEDARDLTTAEMKAKRSQLHHIQSSIEELKRNIVLEDDVESYLKHSREEGFYCGTAQIVALSEIYRIPIEVIFDYSKETERREVFNPTQSEAPKLTLAFINNNHFKLHQDWL